MLLDGEHWQSYFTNFQRSAFRLEVHQTYTMPGEVDDLARYRAGASVPEDFNADWHQKIRTQTAAGRSLQRAKIVRRPLTEYTRYLFDWAIPGNVDAGEDYRIVDLTDVENARLPEQDFWFFDDTTVVLMNYRSDGTQIGRELLDDPDLEQFRGRRDLALEFGVPFKEYVSRL